MNCKLATLLAAVALGAFSQAASAADLPARPVYREAAVVPVVPVVANWTGIYVGAGGGYGTYNADSSIAFGPGTIDNGRAGGRGWFGTVQIGYDYQWGSWVAGIFADYDFSSIKGTISDMSLGGGLVPFKQDWAWSAGGRIGYLVVPQLLTYFSGGYSNARFAAGTESGFSGLIWPDQTFDGWFLGSGLEYMIAPGWFVKTEYRYATYSSKTLTSTVGGIPGPLLSVKPEVQTVRTELVYKFNWGR